MQVMPDFILTAGHLLGLLPMQIPDPDPMRPPGMGGVTTILAWLKWIGFAVVGGSIIVAGIFVAISIQQGRGNDSLAKILWPMAGAIIIGGGIGIVSALMGG